MEYRCYFSTRCCSILCVPPLQQRQCRNSPTGFHWRRRLACYHRQTCTACVIYVPLRTAPKRPHASLKPAGDEVSPAPTDRPTIRKNVRAEGLSVIRQHRTQFSSNLPPYGKVHKHRQVRSLLLLDRCIGRPLVFAADRNPTASARRISRDGLGDLSAPCSQSAPEPALQYSVRLETPTDPYKFYATMIDPYQSASTASYTRVDDRLQTGFTISPARVPPRPSRKQSRLGFSARGR